MRDPKPQAEWWKRDYEREGAESAAERIYEAVKSAMSHHPTTTGEQDHLIASACQQAARSIFKSCTGSRCPT